MTQPVTEAVERRRHVVRFILSSIFVGVVGLVTAIIMTVTGILNTFSDVSASYENVFETGIEVGPITTSVELENANYAVLTFSDSAQQPAVTEQARACSVTNEYGHDVAVEVSSQPISATAVATSDYDLTGTNYVIYTNFEATQGTYAVTCDQFGLLSDGGSYNMGGTAIGGVVIGVGSVVVAGVLFVIGLVNHARNRKDQRKNPRRFVDYRIDYP